MSKDGPEITWIPTPEPEEDFGLDPAEQAVRAARAYLPLEPILRSFLRQPQIATRYPDAPEHLLKFTQACFMNKGILHHYAPEQKSTMLLMPWNEEEDQVEFQDPVNMPIDFDYRILERLEDMYVFEDPEYYRTNLDDPSVLMMEILILMKKVEKLGIEEIVEDYGAEWMKLLAMDQYQFMSYLYEGSHIPYSGDDDWDDDDFGPDGFPKGPYPEGDDDLFADI